MTDNRPDTDGTIRDPRPGEALHGPDGPRITLSVLNASHERFRILKTYAQGGLGVVSQAYDIELDRIVAVKEMRVARPTDDDVQRFLLEARLTGQLDHPGIPPVYALGYFEDGRPFYAMRLVDGVTLRSAIKDFHAKYPAPNLSRQRSLDLRQLIGAIVRVCNTLRFAHSKGVLHRDIKPSNIMLGEYGETMLMDWGLAKSQKQILPYSDLEAKAHQQRKRLEDPEDTGTGSVMGTPHFMSPEQAIGDVESINQRSEVYSVGATLYAVLTGKPPFSGQTRDEILEKVRRGDFVPPRDVDSRVPRELNAICMKAMALERGDRYADTGELATDIEHWLADESVSCYREPRTRRWQRWVRAHQAWVAGFVALTATCFVGSLIGTYLVAIKHREAVIASRRADSATAKAEAITEQSLTLLSRTFVTTFNGRMRNLPGTQHTRLEVLQLFIQQFEEWSNSSPDDPRNKHELANAIYERSLIYNELNELDLAWADMQRALHLLGELLQLSDTNTRNSAMLDRMHLLAEIVKLRNEMDGSRPAVQGLADELYFWVAAHADTNSQTPIYQFHRAQAAILLGQLKHSRGQKNEAFELVSKAEGIYTRLLSRQFSSELEAQLFQGISTTRLELYRSLFVLATLAWELGDRQLAIEYANRVNAAFDRSLIDSSVSFDAWKLDCENRLLLIRLGQVPYARVEREFAELSVQVERELNLRPDSRELWQLRLALDAQLAAHYVYSAQIEQAWHTIRCARYDYEVACSLTPTCWRYAAEEEALRTIAQHTPSYWTDMQPENENTSPVTGEVLWICK